MTDTYKIDIRFKTKVPRSKRVALIAEAFGLGLDDKEFVIFDNLEVKIPDGSVVYITGQSGAGKSLLLRELSRQMEERGKSVINIEHIQFDPDLALIDQIGTDIDEALKLLSKAGLNDAYLFVRTPGQLSDGQRYRFRLAKAIESGAKVWVADEFLAVLDRTAAKVIAYSMQHVARSAGSTLMVATTHTDMVPDLAPSVLVEKRYREKLRVAMFDEVRHECPHSVYERLLGVI